MTAFADTPLRIDHIERSGPPWRHQRQTECGRDITADAENVVSRADAADRVKRLGHQRAAFSLCMTCKNVAGNHGDWTDDPCGVVTRNNHSHSGYYGPAVVNCPDARELRAIALLVDAHRDEFLELLGALDTVTPIRSARDRRRRA